MPGEGRLASGFKAAEYPAELPLGEKASGQKNVECRPQGLTASFMLNPGLILTATNLT
jgi:hypothetical protein